MDPLRYVVYGAGAVGGVIGGHLSLAGREVSLVARGAHLAAIRDGGLRLDTAAGMHRILAPAADTAAGLEWTPDTAVLLAVKSHQAAQALADLSAHAPPETPIVCATNGVATEETALRRFGRVYGLCVMLPATHLSPGEVVAKCTPTPGILDIGHVPRGTDEITSLVAGDLRAAGFESEERPDIMAWKRRKLLLNIGNGVDASFRPGAAADELAERATAEGERVLAISGVPLVSAEEDNARRGSTLQRRTDLLAQGGSTWQSLQRGTGDSEIDYLAGEIVLQGRLHGIATPANDAIVAATRGLTTGGGAPRSLDAAAVLASLPR